MGLEGKLFAIYGLCIWIRYIEVLGFVAGGGVPA